MLIPHSVRHAVVALFAVTLLGLAGLASPASAQDLQSRPETSLEELAAPLDLEQAEAVRRIVRDYILENPEIIMEAVEILRQREQAATEEQQRSAVKAHMSALSDPGALQVLGNPEGDVTIVEFFDYRCPYCRQMADLLFETAERDGNIRLVMKEYPILGEQSVFAARAAIAAAQQGKYLEFHRKLMTEVKQVTEDSVLRLAKSLGLDLERLKADMRSELVERELRTSFSLADALKVSGTPAFVIGEELVPGAFGEDRLLELIEKARSTKG